MRQWSILFILVGLLAGGKALSQPYPVTATAQINLQAPYLEQFSQGIPPRVLVSLLLTDFNEINYACKLGVSISGPGGLSLYTTQAYLQQSAPISLTPGLPQVLSGPDLAALFYPDNLSFSSANGLSLEQYLNQGSLPEGLYSICFVAYDENRFDERPVSNQACGVVSMTLHDPPTIITLVGEQDPMLPQHFLFSWQPNHIFGSPVEYNLQVYRVVAGLTPDQIVSMTPPVFQTTTRATAYLWTAADPLLEPDMDYLVLVHARDIFGANQFKNNGFSRFERFRITVGCVAGRPCDDGSDCTVNDRINAACACVGDPLPDTDADGVCDLNDLCELGDDHIDVDADGLPDACDNCVPGMACDDGDPCTLYDTYQVINGICGCSGQPAGDYDADGICDAIDPCDLGPNNIDEDEDGYPDACDPCVVGAACDDGNPNTANDVVSWNNQWPQGVPLPPGVEPCGCAGTPCTGAADSDGDGVCNVNDQCPGSNDALDDDGDGVPNGCDQCPGQNDNGPDVDEDGIPDVCDDEILDECPGVVALSFGHREVIEKLLCTYELFISDSTFTRRASLHQLTVKLGEQLQTLNADTPGFHFAYCYGNACNSSLPGWEVLANDLTQWLLQLGYFALVEFVVDEAGIRLKIKCDKPVVFVSSKVALDGNGAKNIKFDSGECREELITRYILSAAVVGDTCDSPQYVWSTGATTPAIYIYSAPEDYSVTITCANGCVYTEEDANCLIGAPCDDNDPCTVNDHYYDAYCLCGGTYVGDADADGVCDVLDICAGENDHLDINNDSIPDCLQDCLTLYGITLPGTDDPNPGGGGSPDDNGMAGASGEQAPEGVEAGGKVPVVPNIIPCDDGDICTTGDQLILETCECVGIFRDRDQDGVCDALDQCQGFPDHYDFNNNGVPDGCDPVGAPCVDESGNVACQMVQAYCACDKVSKVNLVELSEALLSDLGSWVDSNGVLVTIEYDQEALEAAFGTKLDTRDKDGDGLINSFEDSDGDGVINLIDICPYGDDHADANNNCIPDACEDSDGNCRVDLSRAIGYMFDRDCEDGNDCTVNDFVTCECECVGQMLDGDGDGVCDEEDDCLGGDNNQDYDQDGIADACDPFIQCDPNNPTNACDDGNPCTYGDQLVYVPDSGTCLCMGSPGIDTDHDGVCDSEDVCPGFDDNLDTDTDGIPDSCDLCPTIVGMTGLPCDDSMACTILDAFNADCMCEGIYIDSDSDGVCDEDDLCPGHPDSEDYDGDGIPDGCDPPWYNIGCPSSIVFSDNPTAMGLVLSYAEGEVHPDSLPAYIGLDLLTPNGFYENAAVALAGYRIVNGVVEAFYSILDFPFEILAPSQWGSNTLTISYSEHQKCTFCTESGQEWVGPRASVPPCRTNNENSVFPMPCPAGNHYFVNADGFLVVGIKNGNGPAGMAFDLSSIPDALTVDLTLPNGSALTGSYSVTEVIPYNYIPTPPPPPTPTGLLMGLVTNIQVGIVPVNGQISFDNGLSCPYDNGSIVYNDCTPPANIYTGQPCNDNNPLTYPDYYDASCTCVGVVGHDVDGDGVHDEEDICPGFDDLLDNNGNSVPDSCECAAPVVVESKVVNGNDIEVYFTAGATYTQFVVSYVSLSGGTPATITVGGASPITIPNVLPGVTYSISLQATCNTGFPADVVSTEVEVPYDPDVFYCGVLPNLDELSEEPIAGLNIGDVFTAGDFNITITDITGGGAGTFTGTGYISVPYFNDARVNVSFSSIFVNVDSFMIHGVVTVTGVGLDLISDELADLLGDIVGGLEQVNDILGEVQNILEQVEFVVDQMETLEDYFGDGVGIFNDINTIINQIPYLPENVTDQLEAAMECMDNIPPNSFEDCKAQLAAAVDSLTAALQELYNAKEQVKFIGNPDQVFGIDTFAYEALDDHYAQVTIAGENYHVGWKSVKTNATDVVNARMADKKAVPSYIRFEDQTQSEIPTEGSDTIRQLTVTGPIAHAETKEIFAIEEAAPDSIHIAGRLSVIGYDEKALEVVVVPVNGAVHPIDYIGLKNKLNEIYKQAVVTVNVTYASAITVPNFNGIIQDVPSGWISAYTYEMSGIIDYFKDNYTVEDDVQYLFLVPSCSNAEKLGYNPINKKFGFIYQANASTSIDVYCKTVAHELGHGAFNLEHTFKNYPTLAQGSTNNLMDSGTGNHLHKYQWDLIHNPSLALTLFPEDEDGEFVTISDMKVFKENALWNPSDSTFTFVAPSGMPITLPKNTTSVTFNVGDEVGGNEGFECFADFDLFLFGGLRMFSVNNTKYTICGTCPSANFVAYTKVGTHCGVEYIDSLTSKHLNDPFFKAIVGFPCFENETLIFRLGQVPVTKLVIPNPFPDPTKYKAAGVRQNFDFINQDDIIESNAQAKGTFDQRFSSSLEAVAFMKSAGSSAGCGSAAARYVFAHAQQIINYPGFFSSCAENYANPVNVLPIPTQVLKERVVNRYVRMDQLGQMSFHEPSDNIFTDIELVFWRSQKQSVHKAFQNANANAWNTFFTGFDTTSVSKANELFVKLNEWKDYPCIFKQFTVAQRKMVLRSLSLLELTEENWWDFMWEEQEQENLYNLILRYTPATDYKSILAQFEYNNYELYFIVVNKLKDNWLAGNSDSRGYEGFVNILTEMLFEAKMPNASWNSCINTNGSTNTCCTINSQSVDIVDVLLSAGTVCNVGCNTHYQASYSTIPKITLEWHYAGCYLYHPCEENHKLNSGPNTNSGVPFEYAAIYFHTDYNIKIPGRTETIKAGSKLIVPFCMADLIFRKIHESVQTYELKRSWNMISIGLTILSGGLGSPSLAVRFVSTVDLIQTTGEVFVTGPADHRAELLGEQHAGVSKEIREIWDGIGTLTGILDGAGFLKSAAQTGKQIFIHALLKVWKEMKLLSLPKRDFNALLAALIQLKETIKNIPGPEFDKFRKALDAEIAAFELMISFKPITGGDDLLLRVSEVDKTFHFTIANYSFPGLGKIFSFNSLNYMRINSWAEPPAGTPKIGEFINVRYENANGIKVSGKLEIYHDINYGFFFKAFDNIADNILTNYPKVSEFHSLFMSKNWSWSDFDVSVAAWVNNLSATKRAQLLAKFNSWPDKVDPNTASEMFLAFKADLNTGLKAFFAADLSKRVSAWERLFIDPIKRKNKLWLEKIADSPGIAYIQKDNPTTISLTGNIQGHSSPTDAASFWNKQDENCLFYEEGDFIIKYDYNSGDFIFASKVNGSILGFFEGQANTSIILSALSPAQLMAKMKKYHGITGEPLGISLPSGAVVEATPGQTTTIIGRWNDGMEQVINTLIGKLKTLQFGPKTGGYNVLNTDEAIVMGNGGWDLFWANYNKTWLEEAISRNDVIIAATTPLDLKHIVLNNSSSIVSWENIKDMLSSPALDFEQLTGYGKEVWLLIQNNYNFDDVTKQFIK